ncbi:MAG: YggT family protein [Phycisphaerae bacterium]|nr:YggT family protein [Phycisphaerae bacterium]
MYFYTNTLLAGPVILLIWAIELYIWTITIRLLMEATNIARSTFFYRKVRQLTDPALLFSKRHLGKISSRLPNWCYWAAIYVAALALRNILFILMR